MTPFDPPPAEPDDVNLERFAAWLRAADARRLAPEVSRATRAAPAVARRIVAQVLGEEAGADSSVATRRAGPAGRPRLLPRLLAVSVALHAAAIVLIALLLGRRGGDDLPTSSGPIAARIEVPYEEPGADALLDVAEWISERASDPGAFDIVPDSIVAGELGIALRGEADGPLLTEDLVAFRDRVGVRDWHGVPDHPAAVAVPMLVRRIDGLKTRRMARLGWDADATGLRVRHALAWLRIAQDDRGLLPADPASGLGSAAVTALGMLPFLAEGRHSLANGPHAADGAWLDRAQDALMEALLVVDGTDVRVRAEAPSDALAPAALAFAEDYMLAYRHLGVGEVRQRTAAIRALLDAAPVDASSPWRVWAADAAARAGVRSLGEGERGFRAWAVGVRPALPAAASGLVALEAVTAGVFRQLAGDDGALPVAPPTDTSGDSPLGRILDVLAWQAAYRTY